MKLKNKDTEKLIAKFKSLEECERIVFAKTNDNKYVFAGYLSDYDLYFDTMCPECFRHYNKNACIIPGYTICEWPHCGHPIKI